MDVVIHKMLMGIAMVLISIKVNNKCRIYDKVAVKINQWSLTKINTDDPIRNKIEKSLEPFTKKK